MFETYGLLVQAAQPEDIYDLLREHDILPKIGEKTKRELLDAIGKWFKTIHIPYLNGNTILDLQAQMAQRRQRWDATIPVRADPERSTRTAAAASPDNNKSCGGRAVRAPASLREGRVSSRPPSDGRMTGCPVVPMVDVRMTVLCQGSNALHLAPLGTRASCPRRPGQSWVLPWGRGHLARGGPDKAGSSPGTRASCPRRSRGSATFPPLGGAASSRAKQDPKCANV